MKKTTVITIRKREVWLLRQLPGESQEIEINKLDVPVLPKQIEGETSPSRSTRRKQ